ncbi:DUF2809 domain-containing protein [Dyadobacter sp. LJ53]|uniref:ribosomal maturation YjgA family protein n=1 Tax=Dyadobacter chenwenxiniae TaxID=2906456 RepID=UPI001F3A7F3F|nr:DUF2809 domain-containing protein [Dyadobacter chenwenxiniae]MCF0049349.1 DUF2809 domain-containing protein [Dyadobacter chenwenxiniae]
MSIHDSPFSRPLSRNRLVYGSLTGGVMLTGFLSRHMLGQYSFIKLYVGDVLWAMMVFFGFAFIFCKWSTWRVAAAALTFSVCIELSQLYSAPWIDGIRRMPLGGMILGFTFVWSDLLCYGLGIGFGVIVEVCLFQTGHNTRGFWR